MKYIEIIERARKKHGDKYTYPVFDEKPVTEKIKIICPKHGEFEQAIYAHLKGQGCAKCTGVRRGYTTEDFIRDAKNKFGDKYDYSKTVYSGRRNKVCIICKDLITKDNPNGEFWQKPYDHLKSNTGMPFLGKRNRTYTEVTDENKIRIKTNKFIETARSIWGNKYDYSKSIYKGCQQKICIICPEHGEFWMTPNNHIRKHGCPKCAKSLPMTKDEFIEKAKKIHGDKYDYSKVIIGKTDDKLCIICPEHGEFWQTSSSHCRGRGCPICAKNKKLTTEDFIKKSKEIHGDKYDYSKVNYINNHTPVCIICHEHGEFWQIPSTHLSGAGCPICNESKLEKEISLFLDTNNIKYERQKIFETIKYRHVLPFDFYLEKYNTIIECQGIQHFEKSQFFKDENRFIKDKIKHDGCINNGIKILYYTNLKKYKKYFNEIYSKNNLFTDKNKLLNEIKNGQE